MTITTAPPSAGPFSEDRARALIERYRSEAARASDVQAARLLQEAARLFEDVLEDPRSAADLVQEALARDASPALLRTALRLVHGEGNLQRTEELLRRGIEAARSLGTRVALLLDLADLQEIRLGDTKAATETYERIHAEDPTNLTAIEALLRFHVGRENWDRVAVLCRQLADSEDDPQTRCSLLLVTALLTSGAERRRLLGQCLSTGQGSDLILSLVVTQPDDRREWEEVLRLLQARAAQEPSAVLHYHTSWILGERLDRAGEAVDHAMRAAELLPEERFLWDWLAELLAREARWEELAELLPRLSATIAPTDERAELQLLTAEVLDHRLRRPDEAVETLQAALELDPDAPNAAELQMALLTRLERWSDLARLRLRQAEDAGGTDRAVALHHAAATLHHHLGETDRALELLQQAIDADERYLPAVWLLERLLRQVGDHASLCELLYLQIKHTESDPRRLGLLHQIAAIQEHRLENHGQAIGTHREIQEISPHSLPAVEAIVRLCEGLDDPGASIAALRELEQQVAAPTERAIALMRMADVLQRTGDSAAALAHYRQARELDPQAPGLEQAVGQLLVELGRWPEVVQQHQAQAAATQQPAERYRRLCQIGGLQERHLGRRGEAAAAYRDALFLATGVEGIPVGPALRGYLRAIDPKDEDQALELVRLLEQVPSRSMAPLAAKLLRTGLLLEERSLHAGARLLFERALRDDPESDLARFFLQRSHVGRSAWERVVGSAPPFWGALAALAGQRAPEQALRLMRTQLSEDPACLAASRWCDLLTARTRRTQEVEALSLRANNERIPLRRAAARQRLATLAELQPADGVDPVAIHREVLDDLPHDTRSLSALERLARQRGDGALLIQALDGLRHDAAPEAEAELLAAQAGAFLRLGDERRAAELWRRALDRDPGCRAAYDSLKALYLERGDSAGLRWLLERGLDAVATPHAMSGDLLRRAAFREQSDDGDGALADLDRVLEANPSHAEALEQATGLLRRRGDFQGLAARLEQAARNTPAAHRQAQILLTLGEVYRDHFEDPVRARETLTKAVNADPDNVPALLQAAELQLKLDQPTEALSLLNRAVLRAGAVQSVHERDQLCRAHLQIAHICGSILADPVRARASVQAVLELDPDHRDALAMLVDLAVEQRVDSDGLEQHLEKLAEVTEDLEDKARVLVRLSDLLRRRLGATSRQALAPLEQAVELCPRNPVWLRQLVQAYEEGERWKELDALLERHLEALDERDQAPFQLALGRTLGRRGRMTEARAVLHQVLEEDPGNRRALELLLDQLDSKAIRDPDLLAEAVTLNRHLLRRNPRTVDAVRAIQRLCKQADRLDESFNAAACLVLLDEATEEERYFHRQQRERAPTRPAGSLSPEQVQALALPSGLHPIRVLLTLLRPHLPALLPPDLGHLGLESLERARLPANHPAWDVATICSGALKLGHFELVETRGGAPFGAVLPGNPPALLLPPSFLRLSMPDQLFLCGRLLARVAVATEALDRGRREPLRVRGLELVLVALQRTEDPGFGAEVAAQTILDDLARRLRLVLSSAELERAQRLARETWTERERRRLAEWVHSTELGACRTGLLCCGGLDTLSPFWTEADGPVDDALLDELIRFSLSGEYAALRRTLRLELQE